MKKSEVVKNLNSVVALTDKMIAEAVKREDYQSALDTGVTRERYRTALHFIHMIDEVD